MALAIFTDDNPNYRPSHYERITGNSVIRYDFEIYKLLDHEEAEFENNNNPFAAVMQVARTFLRDRPFKTDEDLLSLKLRVFQKLFARGFERERIRNLANFVKLYVSFSDPDYLKTFEKEFDKITKNQPTMGLLELIEKRTLEDARRIGHEEGIEEGIEKGIEKGISENTADTIRKMLAKNFAAEMIADILEIPTSQVQKVKQKLNVEQYFKHGKTVAEVQQMLKTAKEEMLLSKTELKELYQVTKAAQKN